jgi:opacity protein-like surface antigen
MKKILFVVCLLAFLVPESVFSAGIGGHFGINVLGGLNIPSDQKNNAVGTMSSNLGYSYGAGLIYGINNNMAAELEFIQSNFKTDSQGVRAAEFNSSDIAIGGQYRFIGTAPMIQQVVPYIGAGIDVILPKAKYSGGPSNSADISVGAHLKAGGDLFLNGNFALNLELRGVLGTESNVRSSGTTVGKFDPSSLLGLVGVKVFF